MVRGRVLIAEDEATLAWVERFNLECEGYEVQVAQVSSFGSDPCSARR